MGCIFGFCSYFLLDSYVKKNASKTILFSMADKSAGELRSREFYNLCKSISLDEENYLSCIIFSNRLLNLDVYQMRLEMINDALKVIDKNIQSEKLNGREDAVLEYDKKTIEQEKESLTKSKEIPHRQGG